MPLAYGIYSHIAVFTEALAPEEDSQVTYMLQNGKFGLMLDESNDNRCNKQLVILARVFDPKVDDVKTKFVDMPICNSGTGQNLFDTVDKVFR